MSVAISLHRGMPANLPAGAWIYRGRADPSVVLILDESGGEPAIAEAGFGFVAERLRGAPADGAVVAAAFIHVQPADEDEYIQVDAAYLTGPVGALPGFVAASLYQSLTERGTFLSISEWDSAASWAEALAEHAAMLDAMVATATDVRVFDLEPLDHRELSPLS